MSTQISNRNDWVFSKCKDIINDKDAMIKHLTFTMLNKTIKMFNYNNLPDTINNKDLEIILQTNGYAIFKKVDDKLYCFWGGLGGEPNAYYLPTLAIVANPYLKYQASLKIDDECVVMLNDYFYQGFMPLFSKYATLLTEAELSLKYAIWNARVPALASADNDKTYASAVEFFKKVTDGKDYGVIASAGLLEGLKTHSFTSNTNIRDLIEAIQYIKGSWYNEVGLNASFNMKREAINEAEANINNDILFPTMDSMLECRQKAVDKINKMFGTNIEVELDSTWSNAYKEEELTLEKIEAEIESLENDVTVEEVSEDVKTEDVKEGDENADT